MRRGGLTRISSGFTLIELLVVIAIIAILAAILFPVFAQAREKARQASCLSNLKQLSLAVNSYTVDYDETYPFSEDGTGQAWYQTIQPYVKNGTKANDDPSTDFVWGGGVFQCSSWPDPPDGADHQSGY
ncbi:MAG: DUF1559 domain-containing protein, partial [Cytophagales bacterium]|nr:DUF1559 domain-containing protein [Armatimonadota bacterium]